MHLVLSLSQQSLYAVLADADGPDALTDPLGCPAPDRYARCDSSSSSSSPGPSSALAEMIDLPGLGVEHPGVESPVLSLESSVLVRAWPSRCSACHAVSPSIVGLVVDAVGAFEHWVVLLLCSVYPCVALMHLWHRRRRRVEPGV
jgi:hypothetical protein